MHISDESLAIIIFHIFFENFLTILCFQQHPYITLQSIFIYRTHNIIILILKTLNLQAIHILQ